MALLEGLGLREGIIWMWEIRQRASIDIFQKESRKWISLVNRKREKNKFFFCVLFNISIIIALCLNWRYRRTDGDPARKKCRERERNVIIIIKWFLVLVHVFFFVSFLVFCFFRLLIRNRRTHGARAQRDNADTDSRKTYIHTIHRF